MVGSEIAALKAAYVFNISKLVEWPDNAPGSARQVLSFCVLGGDSKVFKQLSEFAGQTVHNRAVKFNHYFGLQYAALCDVLYVSQSEYPILGKVFDNVRELPILTISDIPEFLALGGMLELRQVGSQIQFLANPQCAALAGLTISSDLLTLARNRRDASGLDCQ